MKGRVSIVAAIFTVAAPGWSASGQQAPAPVVRGAPVVESEIRAAAVERFKNLDRCPGVVVGVKRGDEKAITFALGHVDAEKTAPVTVDYPFRIASVTKPFLGTLVLMLADEGKLSLDDRVSQYVDDVPNGSGITIRMLGNNTSGIFNSIADMGFREAMAKEPAHGWTASEILSYALKHPAAFEPGAKWAYSNTNAVVLGEVVKKVTGTSWHEALASRVLKPMELRHTGAGAPPASVSPGLPKGYRYAREGAPVNYGNVWIDASAFSASWADAAGDMYSTVGDLVSAGEALATGEMLSEKSRTEYHGWVDTGAKSSAGEHSEPATIYYGFCVGKRSLGDREWIGHTGDVPGFSSFLAYEKSSRTTVVVLANLSNTSFRLNPAEEVAEAVIAAIFSAGNRSEGNAPAKR